MTAREEILGRIRTALADRPEPAAVTRDYRTAGTGPADSTQPAELDELLTDRLVDYRASVDHCANTEVAAHIEQAIGRRTRFAVPIGFPTDWLPSVDVLAEPYTTSALDQVDGVLSTCAVAIAQTGTIVLDHGPGQGPRAASLVPDYHLVIVRADQIVLGVPEALARLDPQRPLTWISGPSATSDIELQRIEGVHGPRTLHVIIAR